MINEIYVDMDGVLCNFEKRYLELFDEEPGLSRDKKEFSKNWTTFVKGRNFETLDLFPGAYDLVSFLNTLNRVKLQILSSSGGERYHSEVEKQKRVWLLNHGITYKANIVSGRKKKAEYATPNALLIDDTPDVVDTFKNAGGKAILHTNASVTIGLIREMMLYNA